MANKSRFIIKRTDKVRGIDDVVLESDGLTIGRLTGNDLVLNHRSVSRTHAGIKEIEGEFRIFNLSRANGTLVNGQLVERQATLSDGDIIQIGPFVLTVNYLQKALRITVEMDLEVVPLEAQADLTNLDQSESSAATMMKPDSWGGTGVRFSGRAVGQAPRRRSPSAASLRASSSLPPPRMSTASTSIDWERTHASSERLALAVVSRRRQASA